VLRAGKAVIVAEALVYASNAGKETLVAKLIETLFFTMIRKHAQATASRGQNDPKKPSASSSISYQICRLEHDLTLFFNVLQCQYAYSENRFDHASP
jgi:hypothetical protein